MIMNMTRMYLRVCCDTSGNRFLSRANIKDEFISLPDEQQPEIPLIYKSAEEEVLDTINQQEMMSEPKDVQVVTPTVDKSVCPHLDELPTNPGKDYREKVSFSRLSCSSQTGMPSPRADTNKEPAFLSNPSLGRPIAARGTNDDNSNKADFISGLSFQTQKRNH
jgi:hypothetical protein